MKLFIHMVYLLDYILLVSVHAMTLHIHMVYLLNYIATGVCYETVHTHGLSIELYSLLCM